MRITVIVALLATTYLTGCMTAEERAAARNAQDDNKCLTYGAQRGTPAYVECRTQLDTTRTMASAVHRSHVVAPVYTPPAPPVTCMRVGTMVTCN